MNQYFSLLVYLENMKNKISIKRGKFYNLMDFEITNTIQILKSIQDTLKKPSILTNKPQTVIPKKPKKSKKGKKKNSIEIKRNVTKDSLNENKAINTLPKMKIINKYFEKEKNKQIDDFQSEDMNERTHSNIDLRHYQNQIPKSGFNRNEDDSISQILESCNVLDSSYSLLKYDGSGLTLRSKNENVGQIDYTVIPPKRLESSSYLDFDN